MYALRSPFLVVSYFLVMTPPDLLALDVLWFAEDEPTGRQDTRFPSVSGSREAACLDCLLFFRLLSLLAEEKEDKYLGSRVVWLGGRERERETVVRDGSSGFAVGRPGFVARDVRRIWGHCALDFGYAGAASSRV